MKQEKYPCEACANRCPVMCDGCTIIASPSGKERRPSRFLRLKMRIYFSGTRGHTAVLKDELAELIRLNAPLPLALVMEYNRRVEPGDEPKEV